MIHSYFIPRVTLTLLIVTFVAGCQPGDQSSNKAVQELSSQEKNKFNQYMVKGRQLYQTHCSNCHQEDGTGVAKLIPPLKNSDYLLDSLEASVCLTKYGIDGPMEVSGQVFNQPMPGSEKLTPLEIAQIITYCYNTWGNEGGWISVNKVESILETCNQNPKAE